MRMNTYPALSLDEGTYYFLLMWEFPPEDAEEISGFEAEIALVGLSDDPWNMEIMKEVLCGIDESFQLQDLSREVLLQALSNHLVCGTLRIAHTSVIPRGISCPTAPEEEASPIEEESPVQQTEQTQTIKVTPVIEVEYLVALLERNLSAHLETGATEVKADGVAVEVSLQQDIANPVYDRGQRSR